MVLPPRGRAPARGLSMLVVHAEKHLGEFAIDVSFNSDSGATALFGPSGAGKTSIINMVAGLLRPDHGRIVLDGADAV